MQAGNRHQVRHARALKGKLLVLRQAVLIAQQHRHSQVAFFPHQGLKALGAKSTHTSGKADDRRRFPRVEQHGFLYARDAVSDSVLQ